MKSEHECEDAAVKALTDYVNCCKCDSVVDAQHAIQKMVAVSLSALDKVTHGKMEIVQ